MILAGVRGERIRFSQHTASLIDVVFLLLIYFMVTASLIRREGDIAFLIPVPNPVEMKDIPVEALIEIGNDGIILLEGLRFSAKDRNLQGLISHIKGLQKIARSQGSPLYLNLQPDPDTLHYRVIDVMDACATAGIEHLGFSKSE